MLLLDQTNIGKTSVEFDDSKTSQIRIEAQNNTEDRVMNENPMFLIDPDCVSLTESIQSQVNDDSLSEKLDNRTRSHTQMTDISSTTKGEDWFDLEIADLTINNTETTWDPKSGKYFTNYIVKVNKKLLTR